ncbi:hypothetical protein QBC32DRAFT_331283 [Pseudoneurospora amorphoporcata]|uniref:Uncharacterized protein n=1 Tax=Pseudoneurospora amorphoporcata TaxID=241081 RepID=A0AAN6P2C6_9PEZI|nr:hypothetical protein QBC32DRAFT_331283 [Pseudoneurospora amorphoporcata]
MCGQITTKYECPECYSTVASSSENLTCASAKSYGACGSTSSSNREITKRADKICYSCQRKKDDAARKKAAEELAARVAATNAYSIF